MYVYYRSSSDTVNKYPSVCVYALFVPCSMAMGHGPWRFAVAGFVMTSSCLNTLALRNMVRLPVVMLKQRDQRFLKMRTFHIDYRTLHRYKHI